MRIAICTRHAWPSLGGIETEVRTLANALASTHSVEVFAHRIQGGTDWIGPFDREPPFAPFSDPLSGVITRQLRLTRTDIVAATPSLVGLPFIRSGKRTRLGAELWHGYVSGRRFAKQLGTPDVVHRFGGNRMSMAAVFAARRIGGPIVITPNAHPGQWDDDWLSALAYRNADVVVATCAADAKTYLQLGVDPSRIEICAIASSGIVTGGGDRLRRERGISGPLILFVGVRRAHKGVGALLDAASRLSATSEAQVAFVGPGDPLPSHCAPNILDIGEVNVAERDAWIDAADVVCLPSSNESWGLAVSEAWSAGVPVVTSNISVLKERVERAQAGLAVAPDGRSLAIALGDLLGDPVKRQRMGAAGRREWQSSLSPAAVAHRHLEIYGRATQLSRKQPHDRLDIREPGLRAAGG